MGVGNKPKKVLLIERIMSCATVLACIIGVCSIFRVKHFPVTEVRIVGVLVGILGVLFFALATITMNQLASRNSGRENNSCYTRNLSFQQKSCICWI